MAAALLTIPALSSAEQYVFIDGSQATFCGKPSAPSSNYYIVRDDPNVVRVNGYTVISSSRANALCSGKTVTNPPASECCGTSPAAHDCLPHRVASCHCDSSSPEIPITGRQGKLTEKCTVNRFYDAIGVITGTIPVPVICTTAEETYLFKPKLLAYDCNDPAASEPDCADANCDDADCNTACQVKSCEVYAKKDECKKTCEMCDRTGQLLIAIRRGGTRADVFIGAVGKPSFPEYPENLAVIKNRTEADIKRLLRNPAISFADITAKSTTQDLLSVIN